MPYLPMPAFIPDFYIASPENYVNRRYSPL